MSGQFQFLARYGIVDRTAFGVLDDEEAGATSAVYVGRKGVVCDCVVQAKAVEFAWRLVAFPSAAAQEVGPHHLAVVASQAAQLPDGLAGSSCSVSADAPCVVDVAFYESGRDACAFGCVAVGQPDGNAERLFETVVNGPAHDVHGGRVPQGRRPRQVEGEPSGVICLVAGLAQRDEVVRAVAACLAGLEVMDIEDAVLGLAMAAPALVSVAEQYVFAYVPEAELLAVLVVGARKAGVLDPLHVELRDLDGDGCHRKEMRHVGDGPDVRTDFLFDGRGKPSLRSAAVVEAGRTVAGGAFASACAARLASGREKFCDVGPEPHFSGVEFPAARYDGDAGMGGACVDAKADRLREGGAFIEELYGERRMARDAGFSVEE